MFCNSDTGSGFCLTASFMTVTWGYRFALQEMLSHGEDFSVKTSKALIYFGL